MNTERELCHELFDACRELLRYDGIDKDRVRKAINRIDDIVNEWQALLESDELDDES